MSSIKEENVSQYIVDLPVKIDRAELVKQFKVERTRPMMEKYLDDMIKLAEPVARPKGLYRLACITGRGEGWVEIEGVRFDSKVLSKSLEAIDSVVLYAFTCGKELEDLPVPSSDRMHFLCLEMIKMQVSMNAGFYFMDFLKKKFQYPEITHLHPGEFADLPIEAQVPLFSLFENTEKAIGVKLTSNKTIYPVKSGSGLLFYNGASFISCELCLQAHCTGRRAAYNPKLAAKFGLKTKK